MGKNISLLLLKAADTARTINISLINLILRHIINTLQVYIKHNIQASAKFLQRPG
jgi:hypothetical protein